MLACSASRSTMPFLFSGKPLLGFLRELPTHGHDPIYLPRNARFFFLFTSSFLFQRNSNLSDFSFSFFKSRSKILLVLDGTAAALKRRACPCQSPARPPYSPLAALVFSLWSFAALPSSRQLPSCWSSPELRVAVANLACPLGWMRKLQQTTRLHRNLPAPPRLFPCLASLTVEREERRRVENSTRALEE